jgi:hypothetical protein
VDEAYGVTRSTTLIREVVQLNRTSKDALAFRKLAARRCGATTARSAWAVVAEFPLAPMATTGQAAFFLVRELPHVRVRGEASNEPAHSGWFA